MNRDAPILVLHAVGDARGGAPWRDALAAAGWAGPILAPDLPGHAGAPPPIGGHHELADPLVHVLGLPDVSAEEQPIVVGVGANGWSAQLLALGGRAARLVLVDGLGAPWLTVDEQVRADVAELRALAADPAALAPAPTDGSLDPRLRHGPRPHGSRALAERAARATPVPTLIVESPASPTPPADRDALAAAHAAGVRIVEVPAAAPEPVAAAITSWIAAAE